MVVVKKMPQKKDSLWDKVVTIAIIAVGAGFVSNVVEDYIMQFVDDTPLVLLAVGFGLIFAGWGLTKVM